MEAAEGTVPGRHCTHPATPHLLKVLIVVGFLHPLLQQGPQFTQALEAELQGLKAADGGLAEHFSKENTQGEPHVGLVVPQTDPLLLQQFGKLL